MAAAAKDNFAQIPHMAEDELDPYQYRLYGHYVRSIGQSGNPIYDKSLRETADLTKMSVNKIQAARNDLATLGYIQLTEPTRKGETFTVTLIDRWQENHARYAKAEKPVLNITQPAPDVSDLIQPAPDDVLNSTQTVSDLTQPTPIAVSDLIQQDSKNLIQESEEIKAKAKAAHTPAHEGTAPEAAAALPSKAVEMVEPAPETTVVLPSGKEAAQVESHNPLQSSAKVSPGETEPESPIALVFREYTATFGLPKSDHVRSEVQDAIAEYGADEVIAALIYSRERVAYSFRHTLTRLAARKLDAQRASQPRILSIPTRSASITAPPPMRSPVVSLAPVEDDGHIPPHLTPEWEKMFGKYGVPS